QLIVRGEYNRALEVILNKNPLPGVSGYMCTHLCQTRCTRNNYDQPVAIRALKRFAAEKGRVNLPVKEKRGKQVAVIGSGPSGLAAAYFLALNGIEVTIFEAKEQAGGMPSLAPSFRIPQSVIQEDIDRITGLGVKIKLSHPIVKPPEDLLKESFDGVYIASGFPGDSQLNVDGIEGIGVFTALNFLEQVSLGKKPDLGPKVLVIGGGNTAMDAARTARRLTGNPVTVVYRRTALEMPAAEEEKEALFAEGNILEELVSPTRVILEAGRVIALECIKNILSEPGRDGRRKPVPISGSEFKIEADAIIVAVGQYPDLPFLDGSIITRSENGGILVDEKTCRTGTSPIFAGGDVVRGPAMIIQACADGRRAAESLCQSFGVTFTQLTPDLPKLSPVEILEMKSIRAKKEAQYEPQMLPVDDRIGFDLVEQTFMEDEAQREAHRCLQCADFCDKCVEVCPNRANLTYFITPENISLPILSCQNGLLSVSGEEIFRVEQDRQIIHLDDFCNECGNCAAFCVHQGRPFQDKPRLFLKEEDFINEESNAFYIEGNTMRRREMGREWTLSLDNKTWYLENPLVSISLSLDCKIQKMTLKKPFSGTLSLKAGVEMAVILKGVTTSLPQLCKPKI
ncbi:MAG: FAD-dependent oxidoreductase, partial [Dehalobacterium sp.]